MKNKRILSSVLSLALFLTSTGIVNAESKKINGVGAIKYSVSGGVVTAKVDVTASNEARTLVICSYKNGIKSEVSLDKKVISGTDELSASVSCGVDSVKAFVLDAQDKALAPDAVYGVDSTDIQYIKIDGKKVDGFKNDCNDYVVETKSTNPEIEIAPVDGASSVSFSDVKTPGLNKVEITSSRGYKRTVNLKLYADEASCSKLLSLSYKLGDKIYEVDGFNPDKTTYNITLPDNSMSVKLIPDAVGDISTTVTNNVVSTVNSISLGSMVGSASEGFGYTRTAINNYIPLKNESATAKITVSNGGNSTQYTINFTAVQPRITEFDLTDTEAGVSGDANKPVFIGGSALNNDNGTILGMDRRWAIANISSKLLGSSMFMLPMVNRNEQWWNNNTSGKYFSFKADSPCTVCILSGKSIDATDYSSWSKESKTVTLTSESDFTSWILADKTWNDYEDEYFASALEYGSDVERAVSPGVARDNAGTLQYNKPMQYSATKHFDAGEEITIYHTGQKGQDACKMTVALIWDDVVNTSMYDDGSEEGKEKEDISMPWPSIKKKGSGEIMSLTFDSASDTNAKIIGGMYSVLSDSVKTAINSNVFTVELELYAVDTTNGDATILSSGDGNFRLYKKDGGKMFLNWAGLTNTLKMPSIDSTNVVGKKHIIVVDKAAGTKGTITWYVDGTQKSKKDFSSETSVNNIRLGTAETPSGDFTVKTLKIYDKAFTLDEILNPQQEDIEVPPAIDGYINLSSKINGEYASIMVLNKKADESNYTKAELDSAIATENAESINNTILYYNEAYAEDGNLNFSIPFAEEMPKGYYDVYINGVSSSVYYMPQSEKDSITQKIINEKTIADENIPLYVQESKYNSLKSKGAVTKYTNELLSKKDVIDIDYITKCSNIATLIEALNENLTVKYSELEVAVPDYEPIISLNEIDTIKDTAGPKIILSLSGKNIASVAEFKVKLAEAMFLTIINDTKKISSYERKEKFDTYASKLNLNLSKYNRLTDNKKTEALTLLSQKNLSAFADIQQALDGICDSFNKQSSGGSASSGSPSTQSSSVGTTTVNTITSVPANSTFNDLVGFEWAKPAIEALYNNGVISGYDNKTFMPQKTITRAEFITMIAKKYLNKNISEQIFSDVKKSDWYFDYIMKAYDAGIANGMGENLFMPSNNITRQDMATMLYNLAKFLNKVQASPESGFTDSDSISDYAKEKVDFLKDIGVISGDTNGAFRPLDNANRAEAAQMIYKFIQLIG